MSDAKIDEDLKAIVRRALEKMTKEHNLVWNATGPGKVQQILSEDEEVIKKFTQLMSLLASMTSALLRSRSDLLRSPPLTAALGSGTGEPVHTQQLRPAAHHPASLQSVPAASSEPNTSVGTPSVASIGDLLVSGTDRVATNQEAVECPTTFELPEMTPAPMLDGRVHSHAPNPPITDGSSFPPSGVQSITVPPSNVNIPKPASSIQQVLEARNPGSTSQVSPSVSPQPRHQGRGDGFTNKPSLDSLAASSSHTKTSYQKPSPPPSMIPNKPIFKVLPMQGKEYSLPLADAIDCTELKRRLGGADLSRLEIRFPEGLGLDYHLDSRKIKGTPKQGGEFEVEFTSLDRESGKQQRIQEKLQVNPDPESLWINTPSDGFKGTPGWKEDQDTQKRPGPQGTILAARIRGKSHAHVGSPCDDDMFIEIQDGWHILIVADGAGSAKLSRLGSQLAVQRAGKYLVDEFAKSPQMAAILQALESENPKPETLKSISQGSVGTAAYKAFGAILEAAKVDGRNHKDLSTTLLVAMARQLSSGRWFVCTFWIGDGALALYQKGQGPILFGTPDSGEYSGQTRFLDSESVSPAGLEARTRFQFVDGFDALVLMTDGVSDPKFETEARLIDRSAWDEFWTDLDHEVAPYDDVEAASKRLLTYLGFRSPGNHDDRTIAILRPKGVN
ncbi:MAG TPA: PP2C family serine/threonine-protein phosphatase [Fibrobacteria bacterium]|nr:PP2C family serine/threonine-protein phosphatase [Fibrobacteria bacterium]